MPYRLFTDADIDTTKSFDIEHKDNNTKVLPQQLFLKFLTPVITTKKSKKCRAKNRPQRAIKSYIFAGTVSSNIDCEIISTLPPQNYDLSSDIDDHTELNFSSYYEEKE